MDCSDSPTFGKQEGSAYNGHFGYTCYHSLFVFNQFGDIERALLRNGNVYSSDDWKTSCFFYWIVHAALSGLSRMETIYW